MNWLFLILAAVVGALLALILLNARQRKLRTELAVMRERYQSSQSQLDTESKKNQELLQLQNSLSGQVEGLKANNKHLNEKLTGEQKRLEDIHQKLQADFEVLAQRIFEEKSQKFARQNESKLGDLLKPLGEKISDFQKKVEATNEADIRRSTALESQLKQLKELNQKITEEAHSLTRALRGDSKSQGNWGEMQLARILELAGLQKDVHYAREQSYRSESGNLQRLDYIINLPEGRHLILDSKVSLSAYSRYFDSDDEADRQKYLREHLSSIHGHLKGLSERNYQNLYGINPPDYVMMFIANEPALTIALQEDPGLYEKALQQNIALVSSTTLLATLRTVSYIWQQDKRQKNAEEIARQAGALYDKFVVFAEDFRKLGDHLEKAQSTYDKSFARLTDGKGNLVRRTEQIKELGAKTSKNQDSNLLDKAD